MNEAKDKRDLYEVFHNCLKNPEEQSVQTIFRLMDEVPKTNNSCFIDGIERIVDCRVSNGNSEDPKNKELFKKLLASYFERFGSKAGLFTVISRLEQKYPQAAQKLKEELTKKALDFLEKEDL